MERLFGLAASLCAMLGIALLMCSILLVPNHLALADDGDTPPSVEEEEEALLGLCKDGGCWAFNAGCPADPVVPETCASMVAGNPCTGSTIAKCRCAQAGRKCRCCDPT